VIRTAAVTVAAIPLALVACGEDTTTTVRVPSVAMQPVYEVGQELEVDTSAYEDAAPRPDDVVLFRAPRGIAKGACGAPIRPRRACARPTPPSRDIRLLGRVIAGPGDQVAFRDGIAVVDGRVERERQLLIDDPMCDLCELPVEITVPERHVFVAGDNRSEAADSRAFGPVPYSSIVGRVSD
jgi:signal peptidase I